MKTLKLIAFALACMTGTCAAFGQTDRNPEYDYEGEPEVNYNSRSYRYSTNYTDQYPYEKITTDQRKPLEYPHLREADVSYRYSATRVIDTREKQNIAMRWPKNPLYSIIYQSIMNPGGYRGFGRLDAYETDSLSELCALTDLQQRGEIRELTQYAPFPEDPTYTVDTTLITPLAAEKITRFQVKEEIIFDKQRGMLTTRIVAIAPLYQPVVEGQPLKEQPLCWIKYEDLRPILAHEEMINDDNLAANPTYLDFFEMQLYSGPIIKTSNAYDYALRDYDEFRNDGSAALYEDRRIRKRLQEHEDDYWEH